MDRGIFDEACGSAGRGKTTTAGIGPMVVAAAERDARRRALVVLISVALGYAALMWVCWMQRDEIQKQRRHIEALDRELDAAQAISRGPWAVPCGVTPGDCWRWEH